ncbi:hypothetical protein BKA70DRAFT_1238312 [Coprinopsis sp. MPI-PUGE-AT-0042]|nr:hypothetical protein BKA70DRAFT_1238312 [Coprinopsis sp. MPI-PUGE-AT-0042]
MGHRNSPGWMTPRAAGVETLEIAASTILIAVTVTLVATPKFRRVKVTAPLTLRYHDPASTTSHREEVVQEAVSQKRRIKAMEKKIEGLKRDLLRQRAILRRLVSTLSEIYQSERARKDEQIFLTTFTHLQRSLPNMWPFRVVTVLLEAQFSTSLIIQIFLGLKDFDAWTQALEGRREALRFNSCWQPGSVEGSSSRVSRKRVGELHDKITRRTDNLERKHVRSSQSSLQAKREVLGYHSTIGGILRGV